MIKIVEPDARREYETLMNEVIAEAESTGERARLMQAKINDAIQAHREWAMDVERTAALDGYSAAIKVHLKRTRVVVNVGGDRPAIKPRTIGTKRQGQDGKVIDLQLPFEVLTFDQLRHKRREYITQVQAYTDNLAFADRLLALEEMAPGSTTPAEAARMLGVILDDYLAGAA